MESVPLKQQTQVQVRVNEFIRSVYNWMAIGLGLALRWIHIYLRPLHRALQLFWLLGCAGFALLAWRAGPAGMAAAVATDSRWIWAIGPFFAAAVAGDWETATEVRKEIEALDHVISAEAQMLMMFEISRTLRHVCYWLIEQQGEKLDIVHTVGRLKDGMAKIYTRSPSYISQATRARIDEALSLAGLE